MNFKSIIVRLYFMLIHSDGKVNDGEVLLGKRMMAAENISEVEFTYQMSILKDKEPSAIYRECLIELKRAKKDDQIRCIAWLCVLANADGFMDKTEWQFIYKVYHKELNLPLDVIMGVQKELLKKLNGTAFSNIQAATPSRLAHS